MDHTDSISRRKFLGAAAAGIVGTAAASGEAAATGHSIGDPIFTNDYIYIREGPGTDYPLIRTCDAQTGLEIEAGPWKSDGWKWWKYYVNGDADDPSRVRGYGVESYTSEANFAYPTWGEITSTYWDYRDFLNRYHESIDIANSYGTAIRASLGGTVSWAGWGDSYGYYIIVDHGYGWETLYAHLSNIRVSQGQTVGRDEVIGDMGCTGDCWDTHLHFEIKKDGERLNWPMEKGTQVWWGSGIEKQWW